VFVLVLGVETSYAVVRYYVMMGVVVVEYLPVMGVVMYMLESCVLLVSVVALFVVSIDGV